MPKYRIELHVENLLVDMEGKTGKHGFFTVQNIEADNPQAAEDRAIQELMEDDSLSVMVQNPENDPPAINVDRIVEIETIGDGTQPGRVWYAMQEKRWWQFWK